MNELTTAEREGVIRYLAPILDLPGGYDFIGSAHSAVLRDAGPRRAQHRLLDVKVDGAPAERVVGPDRAGHQRAVHGSRPGRRSRAGPHRALGPRGAGPASWTARAASAHDAMHAGSR